MKNMRNKLILMLTIVMIATICIPVQALDTPSDWAVSEVTSAIEYSIVPQQLQKNYKSNITRTEYVLLALKVYDKTGKYVNITEESPFSDTKGHTYETEITKAYNAGFIKGDGKGHFFPDNLITREEISSLIVNLLKQISPDKDYTVKNNHTFADNSSISDWASYYIYYCFENKILNGTGNNKMDPKGNATIEQSIALLYRLANSEKLLESTYGTIQIYDKTEGSKAVPTNIIDDFVETYSIDTLNVIKELSNNENCVILSLWEKSTSLTVNNNSITMMKQDNEMDLVAIIHNINDELAISAYKKFMVTLNATAQELSLFDDYVVKMKANEYIDSLSRINESTFLLVETISDPNSKNSYVVTYEQIK